MALDGLAITTTVDSEDVDLTTCAREPIHVPGAIQPHGALLALDTSHRVVIASANAAEFFGVHADHVRGAHLRDLVGLDLADRVAVAAATDDLDETLLATLERAGDPLQVDVVLHASGERLVVEVEPVVRTGAPVSYRAARGAVARLTGTSGVEGLCAQLSHEVRTLTGFDRVMVYRFDANWNGEVVAEERRQDLEPFLGLHYPASDIPAQARRLYTANWMRLIADVDYTPSPLRPSVDPDTGTPLDLSSSVLRSVSPIHLEYLRNMGVGASMSVSLVVDGRLWGLVACHHYAGPHRPGYDARSAAEFLGQTASQLLGERVRAAERDRSLAAQELVADLATATSASHREPLVTLSEDPRLLELLEASGAAVWTGHELLTSGTVPSYTHCHRIATLLLRSDGAPTFTDHLATLDPELDAIADRAAGALRIGLDDTGWVLWLRGERPRVLHWAGDPEHAETVQTVQTHQTLGTHRGDDPVDDLQVRVSPRKSFAKWRAVVRGRSTPWQAWHGTAAERLRTHVTAILLGRSRGQITIAEQLQRAVVLDEAPEVPGIDVLARYLPAEGDQLGGDWWDVLPLEEGRVAVVVGDVAGHGVHAAAAMAQLRTALRAYLLEGHTPASALDRLDAMVSSLLGDHTATALVATVERAGAGDLVVELSSAGHPPPLLVSGSGAETLPVTPRPMLGLGSEFTTGLPEENFHLRLPAGSLLLLYSDGLVERRHAEWDQTTGLLAETAARAVTTLPTGGGGLPSVADLLLTAVPGGAGDDTTLVLLRSQEDQPV